VICTLFARTAIVALPQEVEQFKVRHSNMRHQVHVRWIIPLICAVTLAPNNPCALAQSVVAFEKAQGSTGKATPQASDKQPTPSDAPKPLVATNNIPRVDAREIKIDGRPVRGAKDAKVTIVFFDDFQCPYAAYMYKTLFDEVMKDYGDRVNVALRETPNTEIHTWAIRAAINADCLAAQNSDAYWDFGDYVHAHQTEIEVDPSGVLDKLAIEQGQKHNLLVPSLQECIETQSDILFKASRSEAIHQLGVRDVPTLFINGEKLLGSVTAQPLRDAINRALRDAGQSVPATSAPAATNPAESSQHFSNSSSGSELDRFDLIQDDGTAQAKPAPESPKTQAGPAH
jgi:protein-disulfide isomerase